MSTAIEEALRFWPDDGHFKVRKDSREARNSVGYCVRRFIPPAQRRPIRGAFVPRYQFDVYAPGPLLIGVEPTITWAMKRADADYFDARRRIA